MKNIFNILLVLLVIGFTSCKKEVIEPSNPQTTINNPANVNPIGYTWELYSGRVYVKNLDNNTTSYYDHFGPSKTSSNLDIFVPSWLPIDIITKGSTIWKFTSSNQFILDGGSTYSYNVNTNGIFNVYGLENGSSRNIEVLSSTNDYMNVKIHESVGNDGTYNYSFYTVLTFVKVGFTGIPTLNNVPAGYVYNGVIGGSTTTVTSLVGTKWVVTKFIQNFVSTYPSDTLEFVSTTKYKINGSTTLRTYNLSSIVGNGGMKSLSLYSFTTLGGDWSGLVQSTFINDWIVNNASFTNIMNTTSPDTKVWMVRLN
jgi:hypothetical protein